MATFLTRDEEAKGDLISWWEGEDPDSDSQVSCDMNEVVLFIGEDNEVLQTFGPGRHAVEFPDGASVAFVTTSPTRIEDDAVVEDLDDAEVTLTATVRISDAAKMIPLLEKLGDEESLEGWLGDELILHAVAAADEAGLDTDAMTGNADLCQQTAQRAREVLAEYGIEVPSVESISVVEDE
jgi:hypothetical protein